MSETGRDPAGWLYLVGFMFQMVVRRRRLVKLRKQKCWLQTTCQP
jgi:hypothetical protein